MPVEAVHGATFPARRARRRHPVPITASLSVMLSCRALLPLNRLASRRPPTLATQGCAADGQRGM